jgi:peroxiredoxin
VTTAGDRSPGRRGDHQETVNQLPFAPPLVDDGAYEHVVGTALPDIRLPSTTGGEVDICDTSRRFTVVFVYPMTGTPGVPLPEGWAEIPGAVGCTAQSCGYRDQVAGFEVFDAAVRGISTQTPDEQAEFAAREHITYPLLSDAELRLTQLLRLPTFVAGGRARLKRASMVVDESRRVRHVLYPVPDAAADATEALAALRGIAGG